jgi:hypothetical protein
MAESERITNVVQKFAQPITIKLKRSAKGQYQWEIEVSDASADGALYVLEFLDAELRSRYQATQQTTEKEVVACQQ